MSVVVDQRCKHCGLQKDQVKGYFMCPHCDHPCFRATQFAPCRLCLKVHKRKEES